MVATTASQNRRPVCITLTAFLWFPWVFIGFHKYSYVFQTDFTWVFIRFPQVLLFSFFTKWSQVSHGLTISFVPFFISCHWFPQASFERVRIFIESLSIYCDWFPQNSFERVGVFVDAEIAPLLPREAQKYNVLFHRVRRRRRNSPSAPDRQRQS